MPFAPQWTWTEVPASLDEILALEAEIRTEAAPPDSEARFALTATAEPACSRLPGEQGIDALAGLLLCAVQPLLDEGALAWTPTVVPDPELHYIGQVYRRDEGWVLRQDATGLRAARRQQTDDARESSLLSFGNIQDLREIAWWDADGHLVRYLRYELSTSAGDYWGDVPYIELVSSLALRWEGDALVRVDATVGELPHQLPATLRFEPFRIGLALRPGEEPPERLPPPAPLHPLLLDRFPDVLADEDMDTGLTLAAGQSLVWQVVGQGEHAEALRLDIVAGCGANADAWYARGRPRWLRVTAKQWDHSYGTVAPLEKEVWWVVSVAESPGQRVVTERPLPPGFFVSAVEISALELSPSKQVQGWCVSELELQVRGEVQADRSETLAWMKERALPGLRRLTRGEPRLIERRPDGAEVLASVEQARARAATFGEAQPWGAALSTVESWLPLGPSQALSKTSALWVALNATLRRFLTHPGPTEPAWGASPHDRAAVGPLPVRLQQSSDEPTLWRARSWRQECEGGLRCFSQDELLLDYEADRLRWAYVRSNSTMTPEDLVLELTWHDDELWRANLLWRDASAWGEPDTFGALELRWGDGR